jgi:hypothetical protein
MGRARGHTTAGGREENALVWVGVKSLGRQTWDGRGFEMLWKLGLRGAEDEVGEG